MKAYKVRNNEVIEVECEEIKYPLKDNHGDTIYANTHFTTKERAYEYAIEDCESGISILTRNLKETRDKIRKQENQLADECIDLERLKKEFKDLKEK